MCALDHLGRLTSSSKEGPAALSQLVSCLQSSEMCITSCENKCVCNIDLASFKTILLHNYCCYYIPKNDCVHFYNLFIVSCYIIITIVYTTGCQLWNTRTWASLSTRYIPITRSIDWEQKGTVEQTVALTDFLLKENDQFFRCASLP